MTTKTLRTVTHVVDDIFFHFKGVEKTKNHDRFIKFEVGGKTFANYVINHHGDGKVALWLNVATELQQILVQSDDSTFYIPPYVGTKGWVGANLTPETDWDAIIGVVQEAYSSVSGKPDAHAEFFTVEPPRDELDPMEFDPFNSPDMQSLLARLGDFVNQLPDVHQVKQFGGPVFKTEKKSFLYLGFLLGKPGIEIWVGKDAQAGYLSDSRFAIPKYTGHNGWIMRQTRFNQSDQQARELVLRSYRHFALKRTLKKLGDNLPTTIV